MKIHYLALPKTPLHGTLVGLGTPHENQFNKPLDLNQGVAAHLVCYEIVLGVQLAVITHCKQRKRFSDRLSGYLSNFGLKSTTLATLWHF